MEKENKNPLENFQSRNEAMLCPTVVYPKPNQYLKTAFIEFKEDKDVYYFTLHTEEDNQAPTDIEK